MAREMWNKEKRLIDQQCLQINQINCHCNNTTTTNNNNNNNNNVVFIKRLTKPQSDLQ